MSLFGGPSITEIIEANTRRVEAERWVCGPTATPEQRAAAELDLRSNTERDAAIRELQQELRETQARLRELQEEIRKQC